METNFPSTPISICTWFKSYYVVWKPWLESKISFDDPRLNRTMQYGNDKEVSEKWETLCQFKSYYVVWKPEK